MRLRAQLAVYAASRHDDVQETSQAEKSSLSIPRALGTKP